MATVRLADVLFIALVCALIGGIMWLVGRGKKASDKKTQDPAAGTGRSAQDRDREI